MDTYVLELFIAGRTSRSLRAVKQLKEICEQFLQGRHQLSIVDIFEFPQQAEERKVLATPTLVKSEPKPVRRIVGDLSNKKLLLQALDISPLSESEPVSQETPP